MGSLRASLCVLPWRDAVLVMAAAGPEIAKRGAEEFGVFDGGARGGAGGRVHRLLFAPESSRGRGWLFRCRRWRDPGLDRRAPGRRGRGSALCEATTAAEVAGYGEVLLGLAPRVPDWAAMASLERILEQLGTAGGEAGAAALAGRGWIEWCRGKGSYAHALFIRADQEHPGYRLAALLDELASRGTLCGWAGRRETAWQRFKPEVA